MLFFFNVDTNENRKYIKPAIVVGKLPLLQRRDWHNSGWRGIAVM
jgi:hypothetical protein